MNAINVVLGGAVNVPTKKKVLEVSLPQVQTMGTNFRTMQTNLRMPHENIRSINAILFPPQEINNNDSKHFLILFRGSGMQFRAIYTYNPDIEEVVKLHGTGPKVINNDMIDKFYK